MIDYYTHFETLFNRDEECMMTVGLINAFFLGNNDTLVEASNTMCANIECVCICEETPSIWIINFIQRATSVTQWNQNVINDMENLCESKVQIIKIYLFSRRFIDFHDHRGENCISLST